MKLSKIINLSCIVAGGAISIYSKAEEQQNDYLLIGGIVLLMFGLYRLSRNVPSKFEIQEEETFVKSEKDEN